MDIFSILLIIHIASGFFAFAIGLAPMFSQKGGKIHINSGRLYFFGMTMVFVTAIPMSAIKENMFLFSIAIFSYYLCFSGVRMVRVKNESPNLVDYFSAGVTVLTGIAMMASGGYLLTTVSLGTGIVLMVFGAISFIFSFSDARRFIKKTVSKRYGKRAWFFGHIARMGGSYIATFTAFAVTNLHFWPGILNWLVPTIIGSLLIARVSRNYFIKFNQNEAG